MYAKVISTVVEAPNRAEGYEVVIDFDFQLGSEGIKSGAYGIPPQPWMIASAMIDSLTED